MASRPQLECVIGESGAGKTLYVAAVKLVEFLKNEPGHFWHNLPLKAEGLAALAGKSVEEVESRLHLIPAEELQTWIEGKGGPWSFFADKEIKGAHIAIDEAHRYFGKRHSKEHLAKLGEWTGGLRHHGATCELITQHEFKLSTDARNEAGVQTRIFAPSQRTEMFSGAKWYDVLQLLSKLRGRKIGLTIVREGVQQGRTARDFMSDGFKYIFHRPQHYLCYDSYNNIAAEGADDGKDNRPKEEWERFNWPRLLWWYLSRNTFPTGLRVGFIGVVFWAFALGGLNWAVNGLFSTAMAATGALAGPAEVKATEEKVKARREPEPTLATPYVQAQAQAQAKLQALEETNRQMAIRLQEAATYAEELTSLVAVVGDSCYWTDGTSGQVGSRVESGAFVGHIVEEVDSRKGTVRLSGGIVLRVGVLSPHQYQRVRSWQAAATAGTGSESTTGGPLPAAALPPLSGPAPVGGGLRSGSPAPIPDGGNFGGLSNRNGPVRRNANEGLHQPPRRSIRGLRGGGTGLGLSDGDSGVPGHPAPNSTGNGSPAFGGGTGGTQGPVLPRPAEPGRQSGDGPQVPQDER